MTMATACIAGLYRHFHKLGLLNSIWRLIGLSPIVRTSFDVTYSEGGMSKLRHSLDPSQRDWPHRPSAVREGDYARALTQVVANHPPLSGSRFVSKMG